MENKTKIQTVNGTIFGTSRADKVTVFIPEGLVGIRAEAKHFVSPFEVTNLNPKGIVVCSLPEPVCGIARYLVFFVRSSFRLTSSSSYQCVQTSLIRCNGEHLLYEKNSHMVTNLI